MNWYLIDEKKNMIFFTNKTRICIETNFDYGFIRAGNCYRSVSFYLCLRQFEVIAGDWATEN